MPSWTKEQEHAIFDRGGTLLVSAAAGSGKTAVLVERVIQKLIDKNKPVDADRLLVVTFTNAAAAEMRDRISAKLSSLSGDPEYEKIVEKQMVLVDKANISTIDSFCIKLVRENFNFLGISPDFRIADESEIKLLQAVAMQETLTDYYSSGDPIFAEVCELLNSFRDDSALVETILSVYTFMRSHPFCRDWLEEKLEQYKSGEKNVGGSVWAKVLYPYCADILQNAKFAINYAFDVIGDDPILVEKLYSLFDTKMTEVCVALKCCEEKDFDGLYRAIHSVVFPTFNSPRKYEDRERVDVIKGYWDLVKQIFSSLSELVCSDSETFRRDLSELLPKIEKLFEITIDFSNRLDAKKREKNLCDFADTEQFALELLWQKQGDEYIRTPLAERLCDSFDEILIDECQDSNEAQDMIFKAVSKNEQNMFLVGDVKQSIYRFRQAMPELFLSKKDRFSLFDGKNYPATIDLSKNFRSRFEVTSAVNFFFDQLMSRDMGGIDYNNERLVFGADYQPADNANCELSILEQGEGEDRNIISATYIAKRIHELMHTFKVNDKGVFRSARFGDFCILLRAPKNVAHEYIRILESEGIPACFQETPGLLESIEISILVALLRVIDNPTLDLDMLTVLYSDLFGFTTDDVTKLRLIDRTASVFRLLNRAEESGDEKLIEKAKNLVESIEEFRRVCASLGVAGLLDHIYRELNLPEFFSIKYKNPSKAINLSIFRGFAEGLEKNDMCSLSAFLRRVDRMREQGVDVKGAPNSQSGGSAVQIMSIHHSKGLEFPICFISDLARKFNKTDVQSHTILHSALGFACVRRDEKRHTEADTIPLMATRVATELEMLSEELRMLYVAMTRAREKLILVTTAKDPQKEIQNCADKVLSTDTVISPYVVKKCASYSQWILTCASRHKALAEMLDGRPSNYLMEGTDCDLRVSFVSSSDDGEEVVVQETFAPDKDEISALQDIISKNLGKKYPHTADTLLPTKVSVSEISKVDAKPHLKTPNFDDNRELSPTQKGTAIHTFMQFADYTAARNDFSTELERLVAEGFITRKQADAVDKEKVERFFSCDIAEKIFSADEIYREFRFMMPTKARDIYPESDSEEEIVVQGIADCIIKNGDEFVILDYKSDAVRDVSILKDRYEGQLSLYRKAISGLFESKKVRCIIYSFTLGDYIEV